MCVSNFNKWEDKLILSHRVQVLNACAEPLHHICPLLITVGVRVQVTVVATETNLFKTTALLLSLKNKNTKKEFK